MDNEHNLIIIDCTEAIFNFLLAEDCLDSPAAAAVVVVVGRGEGRGMGEGNFGNAGVGSS